MSPEAFLNPFCVHIIFFSLERTLGPFSWSCLSTTTLAKHNILMLTGTGLPAKISCHIQFVTGIRSFFCPSSSMKMGPGFFTCSSHQHSLQNLIFTHVYQDIAITDLYFTHRETVLICQQAHDPHNESMTLCDVGDVKRTSPKHYTTRRFWLRFLAP